MNSEHHVIEQYGIDAPGASLCQFCELRHYSGMECPPVMPFGTETWAGVA